MSARLVIAAAVMTLLLPDPGQANPTRAPAPDGGGANGVSRLERDYSRRAGGVLRLFGYELFAGVPGGRRPGAGPGPGPGSGSAAAGSGAGAGGSAPGERGADPWDGSGAAAAGVAAAGDYVLGPGDHLVISFRGGIDADHRVTIDRSGTLLVPRLPPVAAAGQTLAALRDEIGRRTAEVMTNTRAFISLQALRRVMVVVAGEVVRPGRYPLGPFDTVLDALIAAGGVKRSGSLRDLRLWHGAEAADKGAARSAAPLRIDLYGLLLGTTGGQEPRLADGDRLTVPVIGQTVAVTGNVARPGIYELPPGSRGLTAERGLGYAGGPVRPGPQRLVCLTVGADGRELTRELGRAPEISSGSVPVSGPVAGDSDPGLDPGLAPGPDSGPDAGAGTGKGRSAKAGRDPERGLLSPGDILLVHPLREDSGGRVDLAGHVLQPGPRPLTTTRSLGALVVAQALKPSPWLPLAVLETAASGGQESGADAGNPPETSDPRLAPRRLVAFDLEALLTRGVGDRRLLDGDTAIILGTSDIAFLGARPVLRLLTSGGTGRVRGAAGGHRRTPPLALDPPPAGCAGLTALAATLAAEPEGPLAAGPLARAAAELVPNDTPCPPLFERWPELLPFLLGHAVLVGAGAQRPGIYPVVAKSGVGGAGVGGPESGGAGRFAAAVQLPDGIPGLGMPEPGEVLEATSARVTLSGEFHHPGVRRLASAPTLGAVLGRESGLGDQAWPLLGLLLRRDRAGLSPTPLGFSPLAVTRSAFDLRLQDRDRIHLFASADLRLRARTTVRGTGGTGEPGPDEPDTTAALLDRGHRAADQYRSPGAAGSRDQSRDHNRDRDVTPADSREPGGRAPDAGSAESGADPSDREPPLERDLLRALAAEGLDEPLTDPMVLAFLESHAVTVEGEVHHPGRYPIAPGTALGALLAGAGGLTAAADTAEIEVSRGRSGGPGTGGAGSRTRLDLSHPRASAEPVYPGDAVRVAARPDPLNAGSVRISGEVRRPGVYPILRGERLSSLIARAGSLTQEAFPAGAVFTRARIRHQERDQLRAFADQLERQAALAAARDRRPAAEQVAQVRELTTLLRTARPAGRMVVEADPGHLAATPAVDPPLEDGDHLMIPRRAPTVTVTGEVLAPITLQFQSGHDAAAYIDAAGGLTRYADADRAFVMLPNGVSRPLGLSAWNHTETAIPPGATIVVPRDPEPFSFLGLTDTIARILSQLAITSVSLSVLND